MVRGSMVAREIDLEEKRVCVPTPMIEEPFFSLPVAAAPTIPDIVMPAPAAASTIPDIVMPTPVVSCPAVATNDNREPVLQDPTEPIATDEGEPQQPQENNVPQVEVQNVPEVEAPRWSQRVRRSAISSDYKVYNTEESHMEGDPTSYEEAMRSSLIKMAGSYEG